MRVWEVLGGVEKVCGRLKEVWNNWKTAEDVRRLNEF